MIATPLPLVIPELLRTSSRLPTRLSREPTSTLPQISGTTLLPLSLNSLPTPSGSRRRPTRSQSSPEETVVTDHAEEVDVVVHAVDAEEEEEAEVVTELIRTASDCKPISISNEGDSDILGLSSKDRTDKCLKLPVRECFHLSYHLKTL